MGIKTTGKTAESNKPHYSERQSRMVLFRQKDHTLGCRRCGHPSWAKPVERDDFPIRVRDVRFSPVKEQ